MEILKESENYVALYCFSSDDVLDLNIFCNFKGCQTIAKCYE